MKIYPLKLDYIAKTALWGGSSLKEKYNKKSELDKLAETWELSVRKNEKSTICNGEYANTTLEDYIKENGNSVVSRSYDGTRFPLLVKFIDAADSLSVQVHPDDEYASREEDGQGKTEMWYILDADEGASLVYGLADGASERDFCASVDAGNCMPVLREVNVKKGDVFFIPAGMVHAIGKGIRIAEIQQNCDLTYRVYDFDRVGADGKKRELHTEKAKACVKALSDIEAEKIRFECKDSSDTERTLAHCRYFKTDLLEIEEKQSLGTDGSSFANLLALDGEGSIVYKGEDYPISCGDSYFIPATMGEYEIRGKLSVLKIEL